jgi:hypothetical protein
MLCAEHCLSNINVPVCTIIGALPICVKNGEPLCLRKFFFYYTIILIILLFAGHCLSRTTPRAWCEPSASTPSTHSSGSLLFSSNTQVRFLSVLRGARGGAVRFFGVVAAGMFILDPAIFVIDLPKMPAKN